MSTLNLNLKRGLIYLIALLLIGITIEVSYLQRPFIHQKEGAIFYLKPGMSNKHFIEALSTQYHLPLPFLLTLFTNIMPHSQLKTGEYLFPYGGTPYSIWKQVTEGKGFYHRSFTVVPGWSFAQMRQELNRAFGLKHITKSLTEAEIMERLGHQELAPEGEFYPETYHYTRGIQDLVILKRAYDMMQLKLKEAWSARANDLPYKKPYDALIAASIIEKEAFLEQERKIIASVLVNRLKKDMLLQFDPTLIYGLKERFTGKIYKHDLQDDNPYNTYVHKGLPPTPIAMPSHASLEAVLHPESNDYLYFVAKGDGSHQFSENLIEHHIAVAASAKRHGFFNYPLLQKYVENMNALFKININD